MSNDSEPDSPEPTPAEEQVRRLLADARYTEPMPDDVAARLDRVVSGLAGERRDADRETRSAAVAADLAAARRRRTVRNLLVAAAAIVAVGFGLNAVDLTVSGSDDDSAASGTADAAGDVPHAAEAPASDRAGPAAGGDSGARELEGSASYEAAEAAGPGVVRLSADRFGQQVRRLQAAPRDLALKDSASAPTDGLFSLSRSPLRSGCSTRGWGEGLLVPARYDGQLGAVVFRKASGETQVVDLYLCGSDDPARSITLPVR